MGVTSLTDVLTDLCFGPIPTALMIADPAYLIGNMTADTFPEIPLTSVSEQRSPLSGLVFIVSRSIGSLIRYDVIVQLLIEEEIGF